MPKTFNPLKLVSCDDKATIYQLEHRGDDFYYRIWGTNSYIVKDKCLYTDDIDVAVEKVTEAYYAHKYGNKNLPPELVVGPKFGEVAKKYLRDLQRRANEKEVTQSFVNDSKSYVEKYWIPHIGAHRAITNIKNDDLSSFREKRIEIVAKLKAKGEASHNTRDEISTKSLKAYIDVLYAILNFAIAEGYLTLNDMPNWRVKKLKKNKRACFTEAQYDALLGVMPDFVHQPSRFQSTFFTRSVFQYWFEFMASTGLRIGEARMLRFKDVSELKVTDEGTHYYMVHVRPFTQKGTAVKTGERDVSALSNTAYVIPMLKLLYGTDRSKGDDYVFQTHKGGLRRKDFEDTWKDFLAFATDKLGEDFKNDTEDRRYDPYSLRHYYATERILQGVTWDVLALNLGHSDTDMLRTYYAHVRSQDFVNDVNMYRNKVGREVITQERLAGQ